MYRLFFIISLVICFSNCDNSVAKKKELEARAILIADSITQIKVVRHKALLWAKQVFVARWSSFDNQYDSIKELASKRQFTYSYFKNHIIATAYFPSITCTDYTGNIEIIGDSLILKLAPTTTIFCTSISYSKINYLINNPSRKLYKIGIKE